MGLSDEIQAVYQRALRLRQQATASPIHPDLLNQALQELYFVLEELHTANEEIRRQNRDLAATRRQIEQERKLYRVFFEQAPDGYLVTDHQGNIRQANRAATAIFGVPLEALVGKPLVVLLEAGDRLELQQRLSNPGHQQPWHITLRSRQPEAIAVEIITTYLTDSQTQFTPILWSLRDTTQRRP